MKKVLLFLLGLSIAIFAVACSNESKEESANNSAADYDRGEEGEGYGYDHSGGSDDEDGEAAEEDHSLPDDKQSDRKIIYTAYLDIVVKDYQQSINQIQNQVTDYGGYVVESNTNRNDENEMTSGSMTVRIPQDHFQKFIQIVEDGSYNVLESSTSGQDVTEEYVDLESRLKSKRVVEERLLSFMEEAEKTEDLLTISNDLAKVQGEIEEILGRMKYLDNRTDLATVTIRIQENNVSLTSINDGDLNTWDKTKQQFLKSINSIITFFSSLFIFIVGNLPVLIIIAILGFITMRIFKRKKGHKHGAD
ncbi:DUF4349 domain-containing protein [Ornithinibacillus halophilus]|uniref:DUF4349 domain-containing protein n=1 Tax=Ornithinibacillus halophilus TaxID=930117 RepID=A0A1M5FTV7_9BACI|nr:DUF4349 domain-containing protein [Ornithinibacillus halophilus]SHF94824.1 protein of unknown function [Ornithinibacillus halophilus]